MSLGKVEICGVNTAKLETIKESEKIELLKRAKTGDMSARDRLIRCNLKLVLSVIQRFMNRGELPDDLFQVGCVGLIKAIDNFDISVGVRFSTYAVPMIMGELRRYLRDYNSVRVSRSMRDLAYRVMQAREMLQTKFGRDPSVSEIAKELGNEPDEVIVALESARDPLSLYDSVYSDGGDAVLVMDSIGDTVDEGDWICEISIKEAIEELSKREREILSMRYMCGYTQMQVACRLGISQAQVSRIEKATIGRIKEKL